ncbi:spore coat protein U domain-containing protein [Acinetobacter tianfuensis]|uniref:Spore coat protein U/FanG domain-containing protein n=1 Tax=Acinetobacter tianfuensis TaxID=2419603 RepID=A0A3A8E684_9GAMM|nr:spore coat protein U domain-containing protein [Acinetobacter tianfuensis]RKG29689.1 hypothetical protein D7V32_14025 [Acinetobacter tianfuensis]
MNSLLKLSSALLLSSSAFCTYAANQSVTVNYTLTIPPSCTLSSTTPVINKTLPVDGTNVDADFSIKCNVAYMLDIKSANSTGANTSVVRHKDNTSSTIPYNISVTGGRTPVVVNGTPSTVPAQASTTDDKYILSAKLASGLTTPNYLAGEYKDTVTINMNY